MEVLTLSEGPEGEELKRAAKQQRDGRTRIRFLAMALMHDGKTAPEAARVLGVSVESVRSWVHRYRKEGIEGLLTRPRSGRPPKLNASEEAQLRGWLAEGPRWEEHRCARWTLKALCKAMEENFGKSFSLSGACRLLRRLGYRLLRPRPRHVKADPAEQDRFKKNA